MTKTQKKEQEASPEKEQAPLKERMRKKGLRAHFFPDLGRTVWAKDAKHAQELLDEEASKSKQKSSK